MGTPKAQPRPSPRRWRFRLGGLALVLVLAAAGVVLYVRHDRAVERNRELADQALDRLDLPAAAGHLRDYLAERPDSPDVHFLLARTLRRDGKFDEAEQHLTEARRLGHDPDAVRREAFLLGLQRSGARDRSADELLTMAGATHPDRVMLETLYRADLATHNWDRAGFWLHVWLENYPDDWPPRLWQAELLEKFRKYDRARADYLRVLELRPDYPRALLGVGQIALAHRADYAEAEAYLGRYLAADPGHPEARVALALCRYGRGDLAAAREGALGVLAENPAHPGAALLLGTLEAEAGHDEEAVRWLRAAEAGGADPQGVSYQLAQVLRRAGQTAEADRYEKRFTELRQARWALEAANRAAEREPTNADKQYEVGRLSVIVGDHDIAAQWFRQALKQDPNHRPSHAALADYYARQSDPGAAARAEFHRRRAQPAAPGTPPRPGR